MPEPAVSRRKVADGDLLHQVRDGGHGALRELYERYATVLYSVAFRILREHADAEEVVLEGFSQVWRQAARFDRGRGSVAAWLTTIVRTRALDRVRARQRRANADARAARDNPDGSPAMGTVRDDPAYAAEQRERRRHVAEALAGLSAEQRTAIELAYYGGLSQSEIAERLNEPLGTIKTRIRTGMQNLRDVLRPLFNDQLA